MGGWGDPDGEQGRGRYRGGGRKEGEDPDADPARGDWRPGAGSRGRQRGSEERKGHRCGSGAKPASELITPLPVWSPFPSEPSLPGLGVKKGLAVRITAMFLGGPYLFS